jgi:serine/threonine-protein kinase PpkA
MVPELQIPGYTIEREIGRGGMGRVYLAVQRKVARQVAIKVIAPEHAAHPDFAARFVREARIVAQLNHPGIVQLLDAGVHEGTYFMVMEYLRGGDLNRRLDRGLHMQAAVGAIRDVARALDYAHTKGYTHRDVKPENILFREDGSAALTDFGIAALVGAPAGQEGRVLGTPEYLSPEQSLGRPLDGRSDLYSLGIVFYRLLTGDVPFHGDAEAVALKHLQEPVPRLPGHLAEFQSVTDKFLAKRPDNRFQHGGEVIAALEKLRAEGRVPNSVIKAQVVTTAELRAVTDVHGNDPRTLRVSGWPDRLREWTYISTRAWAAILLVALFGGGAWLYPDREQAFQRALYATGLIESPEVKDAWRAAKSLRRDPNQGLASVVAGYRRVLKLNPNHVRAHDAIEAVAAEWRADIAAALTREDLNFAEMKLNEALTVFPTDEAFGLLHEHLANLKRAELLVASTDALLGSRGLSDLPSATTAIQAYHEALRLHPGNPQARSELNRLAMHYGELAVVAADEGEITFAMSYLQVAASASPNHPALPRVRETIQRASTLQEEIRVLLRQAEIQLARGGLVDPPGNNAAELFQRVLATDPDNDVAIAGLTRVSEDVQARADRLLAAGRTGELRALVERAGETRLDDRVVRGLQRRLNSEERRLAELARLLGEARAFFDDGFITAPEDRNAVDRLVRVLRIDPDNREARRLLRACGERLADVAREAHEAGLRSEARQYLELALGVVPDHPEWRRLLQTWNAERAPVRRAERDSATAAQWPPEA